MSSSRVISDLGAGSWRRWDAPNVASELPSHGKRKKAEEKRPAGPDPAELQALRESAFEKGFAAGRAQGIESGRAEAEAQAGLFKDLVAALSQPFRDLDRRVEEELVTLVTALVRQLVRREIHTDPAVVLAAVRESLAALPASSRNIRLALHPEDAAIARRFISDDQEENNWKIIENPGLSRGDCKVITDTSQIDATVEHRLTSVINAVFGGERNADRPSDISAPSTDTTAAGVDE